MNFGCFGRLIFNGFEVGTPSGRPLWSRLRAVVSRLGPDPTAATATRLGPDPTAATATRVGPDPARGYRLPDVPIP